MRKIEYEPIGLVHSPFKEPSGTPIQPSGAGKGINATIEIFEEYQEGLQDLEGFSYIYLLYHFHKVDKDTLTIKPYMHGDAHGVFSTRGPVRPNRIGFSVLKLVNVEENIITVEDVDVLDGTPVLDIKPYVPEFDVRSDVNIGWLEEVISNITYATDDGRFTRAQKRRRHET